MSGTVVPQLSAIGWCQHILVNDLETMRNFVFSLVHQSQRIFGTGCKKETDDPRMDVHRNRSHLLIKIIYAFS